MLTQLHMMPVNIYSRKELNGIYFTFQFHHMFCQLDTRKCKREKLLTLEDTGHSPAA